MGWVLGVWANLGAKFVKLKKLSNELWTSSKCNFFRAMFLVCLRIFFGEKFSMSFKQYIIPPHDDEDYIRWYIKYYFSFISITLMAYTPTYPVFYTIHSHSLPLHLKKIMVIPWTRESPYLHLTLHNLPCQISDLILDYLLTTTSI